MNRNFFKVGICSILLAVATMAMLDIGMAAEKKLHEEFRIRSVDLGGGVSRAFYEYVPVEYVCNITSIFLFVPDNTDPRDFLARSGWKKIAEDETLAIILVTPVNNLTWKLASPAADLDYVKKVLATIGTPTSYYSARGPSGKYMIGYGEASATVAQIFAFAVPIDFSGVAVVDGNSSPSLTADFLETIGNPPYAMSYDGVKGKVTYREPENNIPTPVWIINHGPMTNKALVGHWKQKNKAYDAVRVDGPLGIGKTQVFENRMNRVHRVLVTESENAKDYNYTLAHQIYDQFFRKSRRWRFSPFLEFAEGFSAKEMGIQEYDLSEVFAAGTKKGFQYRNGPAFIKVPASYKKGGPPVPLVFELHGVNNDPRVLAEQTGFWQVADKYGFIVITPQAAPISPPLTCNRWNQNGDPAMSNDEAFLLDLLADLSSKYNIDPSRVYMTGFSNGGAMTIRMSLLHAEKFAAAVSYAAGKTEQATYDAAKAMKSKMPLWIFRGELDGNGANDTTVLDYWKARHQINGPPTRESVPSLYLTYHTDIYRSGSLEVRRTWVTEMAHTTTVEESWMIWEQFLSRYSRNADGSITAQ
jgi:poly(3-hydroxybutyrate) depolymerase